MFNKQIGRNIEEYVDDMLIKSREEESHLDNLKKKVQYTKTVQYEVEPYQMRIRCILREIPQLHGVTKGNRSQSREGESHPQDVITKDSQGGIVTHREDHDP